MKKSDDQASQVVSVRLNSEQMTFLGALKAEMEADLEADVAMGTVVRRIISRHMSKHQRGGRHGGGDRLGQLQALEQRIAALEAKLEGK